MNLSEDRTALAIDYGERRIGIAKSDPTGTIASALTTLEVKSTRQALEEIGELLVEYSPAAVVIGYPLHESGDRSAKCEQVDRFVQKLKAIWAGPIHLVDERHSTCEAAAIIHAHSQKTGKDKRRLDRLAAVIILQRYLDEKTG